MIHFITVHHKTDFWIEVQLDYLARFVPLPYSVHASFTGIDPSPYRERFATAMQSDESAHAVKLDQLARLVCSTANASDMIAFIDSDAFPVADIGYLFEELRSTRLIAIRRDENVGDRQPHPCFCITTVGLWSELGGTWGRGAGWLNAAGARVTDIGGELLNTLAEKGIDWKPLLRTNTVNLHPVLFGVYDHAIYHHAAGSRRTMTRYDVHLAKKDAAHIEAAVRRNARLSSDVMLSIKAGNNPLLQFEPI